MLSYLQVAKRFVRISLVALACFLVLYVLTNLLSLRETDTAAAAGLTTTSLPITETASKAEIAITGTVSPTTAMVTSRVEPATAVLTATATMPTVGTATITGTATATTTATVPTPTPAGGFKVLVDSITGGVASIKDLLAAILAALTAAAALIACVRGLIWGKKGKPDAPPPVSTADSLASFLPWLIIPAGGIVVILVLMLVLRPTTASQATPNNQAIDAVSRNEFNTQLDIQRTPIANLSESFGDLQDKIKELDTTVSKSISGNNAVGNLQERSQAIETKVAKLITSTNGLSSSVDIVRDRLPSESILLDKYVALVEQSKANAVAIEQLQKNVQNLETSGRPTLFGQFVSEFAEAELLVAISLVLYFKYKQQMNSHREEVEKLNRELADSKGEVEKLNRELDKMKPAPQNLSEDKN